MSDFDYEPESLQDKDRKIAALQREIAELLARPSAAKLTREQFRTLIRYAQADLLKAVEICLHTLGIEVSE